MDLDPRAHARRTDPDTSHAAAAQLSAKDHMMRRLLAAYLAAGDLSTDEAVSRAGYTARDGAWKRVSDLAGLGYLIETGERRTGSSGRKQLVRRITDAGVIALARWSHHP